MFHSGVQGWRGRISIPLHKRLRVRPPPKNKKRTHAHKIAPAGQRSTGTAAVIGLRAIRPHLSGPMEVLQVLPPGTAGPFPAAAVTVQHRLAPLRPPTSASPHAGPPPRAGHTSRSTAPRPAASATGTPPRCQGRCGRAHPGRPSSGCGSPPPTPHPHGVGGPQTALRAAAVQPRGPHRVAQRVEGPQQVLHPVEVVPPGGTRGWRVHPPPWAGVA